MRVNRYIRGIPPLWRRFLRATGGSGQIYGIANPYATPAVYIASADVTLTAGSEVTVITTGAITANPAGTPGTFYPLIFLTWTLVMGGTASAAVQFAFKLGSGSDVDTFVVEPGLLVNSAEIENEVTLVGAASNSAWIGAGSTINITGKATTTACTFKKVGSRAVVLLLPST